MDSSETLNISVTDSFPYSLFPSPNTPSPRGSGREPQQEQWIWTIKALQTALKFEANSASVWLCGSFWQSPARAGAALPRLQQTRRVQLSLPEGPQAVDPVLQGIKWMRGRRERTAPQGRVEQPAWWARGMAPCHSRAGSVSWAPATSLHWCSVPSTACRVVLIPTWKQMECGDEQGQRGKVLKALLNPGNPMPR